MLSCKMAINNTEREKEGKEHHRTCPGEVSQLIMSESVDAPLKRKWDSAMSCVQDFTLCWQILKISFLNQTFYTSNNLKH